MKYLMFIAHQQGVSGQMVIMQVKAGQVLQLTSKHVPGHSNVLLESLPPWTASIPLLLTLAIVFLFNTSFLSNFFLFMVNSPFFISKMGGKKTPRFY
jgi:hypothetical protein